MGSGCNNSSPKGACLEYVSSNCVKWVGDPVPVLDICTGDTLTELQESVITKLLTLLDGTGIDLSALDYNCSLLKDKLSGTSKNLAVVVKALVDSLCSTKGDLDTLIAQVNAPVSYNTECLSGSPLGTHDVLQATIEELCNIKVSVDNIITQLNNTDVITTINNKVGDYLTSNINSCGGYGLTKAGTGATSTITIYGMVPPFTPIWSYAPLSNFDSTGKGLAGTPYCGWYICNGNYGTPDMRGYVTAGAITLQGINGPSLDNRVDPTVNSDITYGANILEKKGEVKHQLTTSEVPNHTHTVNDPEHSHPIMAQAFPYNTQDGETFIAWAVDSIQPGSPGRTGDPTDTYIAQHHLFPGGPGYKVQNASTGITINPTTLGGGKHENRQPTIYGYYIVRLS